MVKDYDAYSVSIKPVFISSQHHVLFLNSQHPTILKAKYPPPQEWCFYLEEHVEVVEGKHKGKLAHIKGINPELLDVDLDSGEGHVQLPWRNVRKHFTIGNFIKVVGGINKERTGFIQGITEHSISIVQKESAKFVHNLSDMEVCLFLL